MIEKYEIELADMCLQMALHAGASQCRVNLSKSVTDLVDTLNGEVDKVTHCLDRGLILSLFVDGRFGTFSTNKLCEKDLQKFVDDAVAMCRLLAVDPFRKLPAPERCCTEAKTGDELGLYDPTYSEVTGRMRTSAALKAAVDMKKPRDGYTIISEEGQYSDSEFDTITIDSNGLFCRHMETSFEYASELTIQTPDGEKYSGYWWTADNFLKNFDPSKVGEEAARRAARQIGPAESEGGKMTMVVASDVASKLVTPLLNALGGYSIQQNSSFMIGSLGNQMFPEGLTIIDDCRVPGQTGSRLFDSEGVSTVPDTVIEAGTVKKYFLNTYIAGKMEMEPTSEDCTRAHLLPYPEKGLDCAEILRRCKEGILVTGFNGGNCNAATGDFSYGIEGLRFEDGQIREPVSEMLVTGNFIELWKNFIMAGDDCRPCKSKLIPTLAFKEVDFNG